MLTAIGAGHAGMGWHQSEWRIYATPQSADPAILADACFKDPFNEVRGLLEIQRIFRHMFPQVAPRFMVTTQGLLGGLPDLGLSVSHAALREQCIGATLPALRQTGGRS